MENNINPNILAYGRKACPECGFFDWQSDNEASFLMFRMDKANPQTINMDQYVKFDVATCKNCGYTKFYLSPSALKNIQD